jgi:pyruvate formate lyase activating enzyme
MIGGLLKFTMIDFPGKISAIVFTQGCNLKCGYCHNPELIAADGGQTFVFTDDDVLDYLQKRRGALEGVVITGGEPVLQPDLKDFIIKVKALDYLVKLDTNGTKPAALKDLIDANLLDFVAMDIKAPFHKYPAICGVAIDIEDIKESVNIIKTGSVPYEFRTTYDKTVLNDEDIAEIKKMFPVNYRVQECLPVKPKDSLKITR